MVNKQFSSDIIKACIFDFGGTLYEISDEIIDTWKRALNDENIRFNKKKFITGLLKARNYLDVEMMSRIAYMRIPNFTQEDWMHYNNIILNSLVMKGRDNKNLNTLITKEISSVEYKYTIIDDVKDCLTILKKKYVLGIISNVSSDIRQYLKKDDVLGLFDFIGLSYELGFWKPDPRIFQICCDKLELKPPTTIFVGDSALCDVKASSDIGMHSFLIDYYNTSNGIIKINRIRELIDILHR